VKFRHGPRHCNRGRKRYLPLSASSAWEGSASSTIRESGDLPKQYLSLRGARHTRFPSTSLMSALPHVDCGNFSYLFVEEKGENCFLGNLRGVIMFKKLIWVLVCGLALGIPLACGDDDDTGTDTGTQNQAEGEGEEEGAVEGTVEGEEEGEEEGEDEGEDTGTDTGTSEEELEIAGDYLGDYEDTYEITETAWTSATFGVFNISAYSNEDDYLIAQNDESNEYSPNLWSRFDWTFNSGELFYCQIAYDAATEADALAATDANKTDLSTGCSSFAWSKLTPTE